MKTVAVQKEASANKPLAKRVKSAAQLKLEALIIRDRKAQGFLK